ncbi:hypothetical protein BG006_002520 [Podila minutissima]|uniref:Uncharacterized protein n=1 Tax=Podila minutissima TaxID=64525 RepID=A0A9P5SVL2_9FUNG|nr:hypothetical protein BG006_002520 [Podila minutissima]
MNANNTPTSPVEITIVESHQEDRGRNHMVTPLNEAIAEDTAATFDADTRKKAGVRNSLVAFAERLRSRSRSRSQSRHRNGSPDDLDLERTETKASTRSNWSSRSNSRRNSGEEPRYGDVVKAQHEFMEKLRAEQARNGVTHNVDGLPLTPLKDPKSPPRSRRSSVSEALGLHKPMLSF